MLNNRTKPWSDLSGKQSLVVKTLFILLRLEKMTAVKKVYRFFYILCNKDLVQRCGPGEKPAEGNSLN